MSDLVLQKKENLGFTPEVVGYLASIKESEYSYKYYNIRHPLGIYNSTTSYVLKDFIDLLKELEGHQTNYDENREVKLGEKFQNLIMAFIKFHESCYEVIQGCCEKHTPPTRGQHIYEWLHQNGYNAGDNLFNKIGGELEYFRIIYNKLKHTPNAIRIVNFHNNRTAIMGFYVQAAFNDGSIGPDEEIHPKHHGTYSSDSFNFALRRLYYLFYKMSDVLRKVFIQHFRDVYRIDLKFDSSYKSDDKDWKELYEMMSKLPDSYFPNEFGKKIYKVQEGKNKIIFAKRPTGSTDLDNWISGLSERGDGITRTFRIPFVFHK